MHSEKDNSPTIESSEKDNSKEPTTPLQKDSPAQQSINFIYGNVQAGQQHKGFLSMGDCRELIKAKNVLLELFTPPLIEGEEDESPSPEGNSVTHAEQKHLDAYNVMLKACSMAQSTGVFHIEGSVMLLERLEFLEKELDKIKSPTLKMKAMIKKNGDTRTKKTISKK